MEVGVGKNFVLDTNVLLYDPQALVKFDDNTIIIPITVIEEIDRFKNDMNETGRNSRRVSQIIDALREMGSLSEGVAMGNGGTLRVEMFSENYFKRLPVDLRVDSGDNRILAVALDMHDRYPDTPLIFVTKDANLRIKADAIGLIAENYEIDEVEVDKDLAGQAADREAAGPGSGGYIVLDLPNDKRPLFHDLLKGFEDYSRLKGYEVNFSIDATFKDKIAFKFTVAEDLVNIAPERVRRDFKEYIDKVKNGDNFDDIPIVTSFEEHYMLVKVLKNRISFLEHSYNLKTNAIDYYEKLLLKLLTLPAMPSQNILVQTGGTMDFKNYNSINSNKVIQGDNNLLLGGSVTTSVTIGDSFNSIKTQIDKIDAFIYALKKDPQQNSSHEAIIKDVEKVKDELQDEVQPDSARVAKWLERAKHTLKLGSLGQEVVSAAKELFSAFGIN